MNIIDLLREDGFKPFRKACAREEWASACPFCPEHGENRFICFMDEDLALGGRAWCRQCHFSGTAYDYLLAYRGLSRDEACAELGVCVEEIENYIRRKRHEKSNTNRAPKRADRPPRVWQIKACDAVAACEKILWSDSPQSIRVLTWLRNERGLRDETIKHFHLGMVARTLFRDRESWGLPDIKERD